ncbi:MAG: transposase, partial [Pseudanabaena sp.]
AIRLAILCGYSSVLLLVIVCLDHLSIYIPDFTHFNLHSLYPSISKSWRSHWANIIPFFAFPSEIRRAIYTTKALESMNSSLRKVIKSKQICPVKLSTICLF